VDAEKWRSERVRGRGVPYALSGLLGAKSYDVGEVCYDGCSVSGARRPPLGFAYPLSLALPFLILPQSEEAGGAAAMGGRGRKSGIRGGGVGGGGAVRGRGGRGAGVPVDGKRLGAVALGGGLEEARELRRRGGRCGRVCERQEGGWTSLSVSVVAGDVGVAIGTGPWELWRLERRGLAVPPAGVLNLVALGILIVLPKDCRRCQTTDG
jgi:hypothetical protein